MKKILSLITAAAICTAITVPQLSPADAFAEQYVQDGATLTYTISGTDITITDAEISAADFTIPPEIDGLSVTAIGDEAFSGCSDITLLVIPNTVKTIGKKAFQSCTSLTEVSIGSDVAEIGDYAFSNCMQLTEFTVSSTNTAYSAVNGSLYSKDGSTLISYAGDSSAIIADSTTSIGKAAFFGRTKLSSVTLPSGLTSIGDYAFSGCISLGKISLPISVTTLGNGSFMNCTALTQAVLGSGLSSIPEDCFSMCSLLETVNLPTSITTLNARAFYSCPKLSGVHIPSTVTSIKTDAIGTTYSIRDGANIPIRGFYLSGDKGSAVEQYALSTRIEFLDFTAIPYGDVNSDGAVNAIDASLVLTEYAKVATGEYPDFTYYQTITGDYDQSGAVNAIDASLILTEYANNATAGL